MPIRIYALAKELNIDNKVLVDICTKAGITGKGSALASLSDEEADKLKAFINRSKSPKAAAPVKGESETSQAFRREDYIAPSGSSGGKIPVLEMPKPEKPASLKKKPAPKPEIEETPVAPKKVEPVEPVEPVVTPTLTPPAAVEEEKAPSEPEVLKPDDFMLPEEAKRRSMSQIPELRSRSRRPEGGGASQERPRKERDKERSGPTIKLAPLPPAAARPSAKLKAKEPAPQKPDIKLPLDAIRAGRAGAKPLSEHLRKAEEKRKAADRGGKPADDAAAVASGSTTSRERRKAKRGEVGFVEEEGGTGLGGREQRQLKRKKSSAVKRRGDESEEGETQTGAILRRKTHIKRTGANNTAAPRKESVVVEFPCTVRSFSEAIGVPAKNILGKLLEMGVMTNIAATLDPDMAEMLASEFGVDVRFQQEQNLERDVIAALDAEDDPALLKPRPPIVTFLGHVDHGKTSLLDRIIGINVASKEKGGITQHIRAYRVEKDGRSIAFVDTPGHEAFTEMRARGANVTDIAVLVVAAEDGVMPQTEEAISHARAAGAPIVVALNKIDLPGANPQRAYEQLAANELLPSEWGGETEVIKTSATTGQGIDELLETLLTVAELHNYKANFDRPARGTCIEAEMNVDRGVIAKILVRDGTLRVGDIIVCGSTYGRVKAMVDTLDPSKRYEEVGPSTPVNVTGLNAAPGAGDRFYVLSDIAQARELAEQRFAENRARELGGVKTHVTLENLYERLGQDGSVRTLNVILRADTRGSIEAIRKELTKLEHPEVQVKLLQATVGGVSEADVHLAHASDAIIIGFTVVPDEKARALAETLGVQIRRYDIIYQVTDELKAALEGMLKPERLEKDLGRALVQKAFHISRVGTVAGCRVISGTVARDARIRIIRESRVIGDYAVDTLKREKDDSREVREGMECGIKLAGFNDVKEGDLLEAYKVEEVARTL